MSQTTKREGYINVETYSASTNPSAGGKTLHFSEDCFHLKKADRTKTHPPGTVPEGHYNTCSWCGDQR